MTEEWNITGEYVEACNCNVACQCIWMEPPDENTCRVSIAWHITDGEYGDVDLSGLHAGLLVQSEEGVMLAPETGWDAVLLVDEAADPDQQSALEDIYLGRAGGIFQVVAERTPRAWRSPPPRSPSSEKERISQSRSAM